MTGLRLLVARRPAIAAWLIAAALALRVLVPAGYMPAGSGGLALMLCPGHSVGAGAAAMPAMHHAQHAGDRHGGHDHGDHDRGDQPCAFAGLAMPSLATADQPAVAPRIVTPAASPAVALADARAPPQRAFLRPPLRGPPSIG